MATLNLMQAVDTLASLDLLNLDADGPWPGEPVGSDSFDVAWYEVDAPLDSAEPDYSAGRVADDWGRVIDAIAQEAGRGQHAPPQNVDALAWYLPVHFFGPASAIYVRESAVIEIAGRIMAGVNPSRWSDLDAVWGAVRAALGVLYLHEAFHHKTESFAIRIEIVERCRRYLPYSDQVYRKLLAEQSDDLLEEALACAEMLRRFNTERVYQRGVPRDVRRATHSVVLAWYGNLPPGYRTAARYLTNPEFSAARDRLSSQVHEGVASPGRQDTDWRLAPQTYRGLFDCRSITRILVPIGERPLVPWFGRSPVPLRSVSTRELRKILKDRFEYEVVSGGKGSHLRLRADGRPPLTLPANRETVSPGVLRSVATALGVRPTELVGR